MIDEVGEPMGFNVHCPRYMGLRTHWKLSAMGGTFLDGTYNPDLDVIEVYVVGSAEKFNIRNDEQIEILAGLISHEVIHKVLHRLVPGRAFMDFDAKFIRKWVP